MHYWVSLGGRPTLASQRDLWRAPSSLCSWSTLLMFKIRSCRAKGACTGRVFWVFLDLRDRKQTTLYCTWHLCDHRNIRPVSSARAKQSWTFWEASQMYGNTEIIFRKAGSRAKNVKSDGGHVRHLIQHVKVVPANGAQWRVRFLLMWQQRWGSESAEGHTGTPSTAALTDVKITSCGCGPAHQAAAPSGALLPLQGRRCSWKEEFSWAHVSDSVLVILLWHWVNIII